MKNITGKIIAGALILVLLAVGVLGLLFPLIPGLLFLAIAAVLAARHFPAMDYHLRRNRYSAGCLRLSNRFFAMNVRDQLRLCFWGTLKFIVNGVEWTMNFLNRQINRCRAD